MLLVGIREGDNCVCTVIAQTVANRSLLLLSSSTTALLPFPSSAIAAVNNYRSVDGYWLLIVIVSCRLIPRRGGRSRHC